MPVVGPFRIAYIKSFNDEEFEIEVREDFKYDDETEEEEMKLLDMRYIGDGVFKIKKEDFVKFCLKCDPLLKQQI